MAALANEVIGLSFHIGILIDCVESIQSNISVNSHIFISNQLIPATPERLCNALIYWVLRITNMILFV